MTWMLWSQLADVAMSSPMSLKMSTLTVYAVIKDDQLPKEQTSFAFLKIGLR